MTKLDVLDVFALFSLAYPNAAQFRRDSDALEPMVLLWSECCEDIDRRAGLLAAKELCKTSKFCPSIAEFREKAKLFGARRNAVVILAEMRARRQARLNGEVPGVAIGLKAHGEDGL